MFLPCSEKILPLYSGRKNRMVNDRRFLLFLFIILISCWIGHQFEYDISALKQFLSQIPLTYSGLIFIILYVLTSSVAWYGPKDFFRITGAVFFGGWISSVFIWVSEMINSYIMFHLSRKLGRDYVQRVWKIPVMPSTAHLEKPLWWAFALRTNPFVPFRVQDLGYGLTQIPYQKYLQAIWHITFIRILWIQCIVAYLGDLFLRDWPFDHVLKENQQEVLIFFQTHVLQPLQNHPYILKVSFVYGMLIVVSTIFAWRMHKPKKAGSHVI